MRFPQVSTDCSSSATARRAGRISLHGASAGQATVEYVVVFAGFLAMVIGLGVVVDFLESGLVVQHALQSASHHMQSALTAAWADVLLY